MDIRKDYRKIGRVRPALALAAVGCAAALVFAARRRHTRHETLDLG